jgi:hypothetical protein
MRNPEIYDLTATENIISKNLPPLLPCILCVTGNLSFEALLASCKMQEIL